MATPPPPAFHPAKALAHPFLHVQDELLEEIFLRLPTAKDLAHACTACASFRRVTADHGFLRRYRALHPPPLVGIMNDPFTPAQPPHASATAVRAFADFDFTCSSFLPSTAGRCWSPLNVFDGRTLLTGFSIEEERGSNILGGPKVRDFQYSDFLVRDLAVCDPVHRRYALLPAIPGDLKALIRKPDLLNLETFLAPGEDEADPLSFRVMCLAQCRMNLLLLIFSSVDAQWHVLTFDQWGARDTFGSLENSEPGLSNRQFLQGCFFWRMHMRNKLLLLDTHTMEFSAVDLLPEQRRSGRVFIVEAGEGMIGMLCKWDDDDSEDYRCWLTYSVLRNNHWQSEKVILLPVMRAVLIGVAGGYLLIEALYSTSSQEIVKFVYFSVDVKTLQVELFAELNKAILLGRLYAGYPPSLCAPTI